MKNISMQVYKLATLLVLLLFINCQKEDFSSNQSQEEVIKPLYKQRTVSLAEIPKIEQKVIEKLNPEVFNRTEGSNTSQAIFDTENILEIIDTLNNANYSFQFRFPDTPLSTFYNLVVGETPTGEVLTPYVMKYVCNEASLDDYLTNDLDFRYFNGSMSIHKYTDYFELGEFDRAETQCPPELDEVGDPIPCDDTPVNGGGSGGGSGSGSGSGSGNTGGTGGTGGGGGSFGCVYQGVYVVGCNGDNNDILHPIGDCWNPNQASVEQYDLWECYGDPVNPTSPNQGGDDMGRAVEDDCPECQTNDGAVPINTVGNLIDKDALTTINNCFAPNGLDSNQTLIVVGNSLETAMANYIDMNGCNDDSREYIVEEIEVLINPYIDIEEELFSVNLLDDDCTKNIIVEEIIGNLEAGTNAGLINTIRNIFNNDDDVTLTFRDTDDVPIIANAVTTFDTDENIESGVYDIYITFSNSYLNNNPTKLSIALTVIHEIVHSLLGYHYLKGTLLTEYPDYTDLNSAFETFFNDRNEINAQALEDSMHVAMTDFIGTMSYSLFKYADRAEMEDITHQYCKDLTKGSFYSTPAMPLINTGESTPEELSNKCINEQNNNDDAQGDDC